MSAAFVMIMFAVLLLLAVPISMALAAACIMPSVFDASFTASATYIVRAMFNALNSFPMLAVPMFILSGILMARGGISRRLFDLFSFLTAFCGTQRPLMRLASAAMRNITAA